MAIILRHGRGRKRQLVPNSTTSELDLSSFKFLNDQRVKQITKQHYLIGAPFEGSFITDQAFEYDADTLKNHTLTSIRLDNNPLGNTTASLSIATTIH
jgi:hypothetical protein